MPILIPIALSLAQSLASQFITSEEFLKWTQLVLNTVRSAVDVDGKLQALEQSLITRLDKGEHFTEADFDAVMSRIEARDARWAEL